MDYVLLPLVQEIVPTVRLEKIHIFKWEVVNVKTKLVNLQSCNMEEIKKNSKLNH